MPRITLSHVFRSAPAKAMLATGCAAAAAGMLLGFPAHASAASAPGGLAVRPSHPFPSFSFIFPSPPATTGNPTTAPTHRRKASSSPSPQGTGQQSSQFNYVSTFSPAPLVLNTPGVNASVSCLANGQPVTGTTGTGGDLDLPGIAGSSKDAGHAGALPISGVAPAGMLPPQIDSTSLSQLDVTRSADASSANLSMIASSGYRFPCIHIEFGPGTGYNNVEYALVNAGLVSDDRSGNNEILTWTYSTILWTYTLPGSAKVHQGSGQINAQPDQVTTSVAKGTREIAVGTIGLTAIVALALILLYVMGIRRNRRRFRQRYYRRAELRAEREAMLAAVEAAQVAQAAEAERWAEVAAREAEARREAETEAAEVAEVAESTEVEAAEVGALPEAAEVEADAVPEAEADGDAETVDDAPVADEGENEDLAAAMPEPESEPEQESEEPEEPEEAEELEAESEAESVEAEPEAEAESESEAEPEEPADEAEAVAEVRDDETESVAAESAPEPAASAADDEDDEDHDEDHDHDEDDGEKRETSGSAGYRKTPV